jgi:hypothetical protein
MNYDHRPPDWHRPAERQPATSLGTGTSTLERYSPLSLCSGQSQRRRTHELIAKNRAVQPRSPHVLLVQATASTACGFATCN